MRTASYADVGPSTLALALLCACGPPPPTLSREQLLDPETCRTCHADHVREWAGSMHAYAADDPVFLAMNARGQRETDGALGDFCVRCHAPMAVLEGATEDGLNLPELPQHLKGVTCYFCHQVVEVEGAHNNPLRLANDTTMLGGISDPVFTDAHGTGYSELHDRRSPRSSELCGACHDIHTAPLYPGGGVHLERTFLEWRESIFGQNAPRQQLTCSQCHMVGREGPAATGDVPLREIHEHTFPGVDVALTPWPETDVQRALIQAELDPVVLSRLCVFEQDDGVRVEVRLENIMAGHFWPSGAAQDRRGWVELVAYTEGAPVYQSGVIPAGQPVATTDDPDLWILRDRIFDDAGEEVHMFWEAQRVESELLPPAVTNDPLDPRYDHGVIRSYDLTGVTPDRVTLRVHLRPMGLEVIDDLIASGDLDPAVRDAFPTFTLAGATIDWVPSERYLTNGFECVQ